MTREEFAAACRRLAAVEMTVQWGATEVYKVGGRIFAMLTFTDHCSLKVSDIAFEALTETGRARPAPYLARAKWIQFDQLETLEAGEMAGLLANAHALVAAKLPRRVRLALGVAA